MMKNVIAFLVFCWQRMGGKRSSLEEKFWQDYKRLGSDMDKSHQRQAREMLHVYNRTIAHLVKEKKVLEICLIATGIVLATILFQAPLLLLFIILLVWIVPVTIYIVLEYKVYTMYLRR